MDPLVRLAPYGARASPPAGARGAGVSGVADMALMALRSLAAALVGANRFESRAAWLVAQRGPSFCFVYDASVPLLKRDAALL